jgi:hypothetical protein
MLLKKLFIASFIILFGVSNYASNDKLRDEALSLLSKSFKIEFSDSRQNQGKFLSLIEYEVEIKQNWDNGSWVDYKRNYTTTNIDGGMVETISQSKSNGEWVNKTKMTMNFSLNMSDSTFRFLSVFSYQWNAGTSAWDQLGRSEYLYDNNNFLIGINSYLNMGTLEIHYNRTTFANNSAGMPILETEEKLNFATQQFENEERITYVYNNSNPKDLLHETEANWISSAWQDTFKTSYTRNSLLNPLTIIEESITNGTTYQNQGRYQITYLPNGEDETEVIYSYWDTNSSTWMLNSRQSFTYTSFGKVAVDLFETYSNGNYNPWLRTTYTYDSNNKLSIELTEEYTSGSYQNEGRSLYSYEPLSTDEKFNVEDYSLQQNYPNPFNPATTINFGLSAMSNVKLTVYNMLGQEVAVLVNKELPAGTHSIVFNASYLASGTYIYRLEAGNVVQTRKMLLMK